MTITGEMTIVADDLAEFQDTLNKVNNLPTMSNIRSNQPGLTITVHVEATG